jgi:hypothetical protein
LELRRQTEVNYGVQKSTPLNFSLSHVNPDHTFTFQSLQDTNILMLSSHLKFTEKLQEIRNIDLAGASVPDSKTNLHNYTDPCDFGRREGGGGEEDTEQRRRQ